MTNIRQTVALVLGVPALFACDAMLSGFDPLTQVTQAVTAEDAATSEEVDDDASESDDVARQCEGGPMGGPMGDGGPPGEGRGGPPPGGPGDGEIAACAPPLAEGVDVGRGRPRGHLAALYDEDESRSLSDEEIAALTADVTEGCVARNAALLAGFDADGDGVLSQGEWDAARAARRALRDAERDALDIDGDGTISREEHALAHEALIAAWDVDDSGDLDADERAAMRDDLQALVRAGAHLPPLPIHGARHGPPPGPPPEG